MKSLLIKLYNLSKKLISAEPEKKFFEKQKVAFLILLLNWALTIISTFLKMQKFTFGKKE